VCISNGESLLYLIGTKGYQMHLELVGLVHTAIVTV